MEVLNCIPEDLFHFAETKYLFLTWCMLLTQPIYYQIKLTEMGKLHNQSK